MTCLITRVSANTPTGAHYRIIVTDGDEEILHDTASSEKSAIKLMIEFLEMAMLNNRIG